MGEICNSSLIMRVEVVVVVAFTCLALGQAASLGEQAKLKGLMQKKLLNQEILKELIEQLSLREVKECQSSFFSCPTGVAHWEGVTNCIPQRFVCDGESDCNNGEDEQDCPDQICAEFSCPSGLANYDDSGNNCVPHDVVCDGRYDCNDGEDEQGCPVKECPSSSFSCPSGVKRYLDISTNCIPQDWKCNGKSDCNEGEDEQDCPLKESACLSGYYKFGDMCYTVVYDLYNFRDAQKNCLHHSEGSVKPHLAVPKDAEENRAVAKWLKGLAKPVWIGLTDEFVIDGHNVEGANWTMDFGKYALQDNSYTNWAPDQPDNYGHGWKGEDGKLLDGEHCATMIGPDDEWQSHFAGQWNDRSCSAKFPSVCQHHARRT